MTIPGEVRASEVRAVLDRATASAALGRSDQLARFLRFVVEETLAGRAHQLKEYRIAVEALGRGARFDPTLDSVVRVQARQLRFKLHEYFIGEGAREPVVIELPKGSYVPVFSNRAPSAGSDHAVSVTASDGPRITERLLQFPSPRGRARLVRSGAAAVVIAGVVFLLGRVWENRRSDTQLRASDPPSSADSHSIVVLPFLNLSGDTTQEYLSDGLTEELTAALANVPGLRVVARTSAFQFKGQPQDVREIGRKLGVESILEGSLRRRGDSTRVIVQLNRASDGVHLWAGTFDESAAQLANLQHTTAQAVVAAIQTNLWSEVGPIPVRRATRDGAAYAMYLEARFFWNKRDLDHMRRSVRLFQQAIARDSTFALAYAGLAAAYLTMATNGQLEAGTAPPLVLPAAQKALQLDSTLGEAHATLGLFRAFSAWDWAAADEEFRQAIQLSPNYATARQWYANTLMARARFDEALQQLRYAQQLDPISLPIAYGIGEALLYARRFDDALAQARTILEMDPGHGGAYNLMSRVYLHSGQWRNALDALGKLRDTVGVVVPWAHLGRADEARRRLAAVAPLYAHRVPYYLATLYAAIGERDSAFAWLDRAYQSRQTDIVSMKIDPFLDPLRDDDRFRQLLRKVGLDSDGHDAPPATLSRR